MKIGFFGILALIFITLKLTHVVAWSWVWVVSPLWIPALLLLVGFLVYTWVVW